MRKSKLTRNETDQKTIFLLQECAFLARKLCAAWRDCDGDISSIHCLVARDRLHSWFKHNLPGYNSSLDMGWENLSKMQVPSGYGSILEEIQDGLRVSAAYSLWSWADSATEQASDRASFEQALDDYWRLHPTPTGKGE